MKTNTSEPLRHIPRRWDVISVFAVSFGLSVTVVPWYGVTHGFDPLLWAAFIVMCFWNGLSITAGYHRLWSHRSYEAHWIVRIAFALGGALSLQNSIKEWCSGHRKHHRYVDDPDADPYAASRGLWYSHIGWMLRDYPSGTTDYANIRDLERDPVVEWQHRWYWVLAAITNFGPALLVGIALGDPIGGLLTLGLLRLVFCHHTTFFINSLAHYWGTQPYSDANSARDNPLVALLTFGEGYHNFHHTFQWDYRNGIKWYHFDPTKWLIGGLSLVRLAHDLKRAARHKIELAQVAMQRKRAAMTIERTRPHARDQWLGKLESEYNQLSDAINAWATCKQEQLEIRRAALIERWERTEMKARLREAKIRLDTIEVAVRYHRQEWRQLTAQFA